MERAAAAHLWSNAGFIRRCDGTRNGKELGDLGGVIIKQVTQFCVVMC